VEAVQHARSHTQRIMPDFETICRLLVVRLAVSPSNSPMVVHSFIRRSRFSQLSRLEDIGYRLSLRILEKLYDDTEGTE
jgi:hypothetical protein